MQVTTPIADVICLYGLPNHELYLELTSWLDEKAERFLVILEDDERVLIGHQSGHDRIRLCYAENDEALKKIAWELVFLQFEYLKTPGNSSKNPRNGSLLSQNGILRAGIHLVASDFQNRGLDLLQNLIANNPRLSLAKRGEELSVLLQGCQPLSAEQGCRLKKLPLI